MTREEELKGKLIRSMVRLGHPRQFAETVAELLRTEYALERMLSYLSKTGTTSPEEVADELVAIKEDVEIFRQKKEAEYYNMKYTEFLNRSPEEEDR